MKQYKWIRFSIVFVFFIKRHLLWGNSHKVFTLVLAFVLNLLLGEQKKLLGKLNVGKFKEILEVFYICF
ncbi:hypothetical protein HMPREF2907_07540 [Neisseria sp. HMSC055H02]|nr:hypothetical protein HMPREF2907_07540 [Neisseria sp. HMSC055H02]